jgi:acetylornithine/succinyldiaminopimelate/putrescine aminotransferase
MRLEELATKHAFIKEVRGVGLMLGVELLMPGKQLVVDAMNEGLLINCTHEVVLRFLPPYTLGKREIDQAIRILSRVFRNAERYWFEHQKQSER